MIDEIYGTLNIIDIIGLCAHHIAAVDILADKEIQVCVD